MRILLIGPGAVGTLLGTSLASAGHRVIVVARPEAADRIRTDGLRLEGPRPLQAEVEVVASTGTSPRADLAAVTVKAFDLPRAAGSLAASAPGPALLPQNGLDAASAAEAGLVGAGGSAGSVPWVRAINSVPVTLLAPGRARVTGTGSFLFDAAPPERLVGATARWVEALAGAGLDVRRVPEFEREVWRKLLVNASINPITAIHRVDNGALAEEPWRGQALALLAEARAVAGAEGFVFSAEESEQDLFRVVRATAANRSSMRQDVERGHRTEIEEISGAILARGEARRIDLPNTRRVVDRIRRLGGPAGAARPSQPS